MQLWPALGCALAAAAQVSRHDGAFWSRLGNQDKAAYVEGYSDATHSSLDKLDNLRLAAGVFHWKGANKILAQVARLDQLATDDRLDPVGIEVLLRVDSNRDHAALRVRHVVIPE